MIQATPSRVSLLLVLVSLLGLASFVSAQGKTKKAPKEKPVLYAVVEIDSEVKIVKQAEVKQLKAQVNRDYQQAVKDHQAAAKAARKAKEKFTTPKPKKSKFKVLKGSCKTEAAAKEFVAKVEAKAAKKRAAAEKKAGKGKGKDKGKGS